MRDPSGRFAKQRATLYPLGAPTFRRRVSELAAIRSAEWLTGARDGWNPADGPNPWETVQPSMPLEAA